jgi:hypothetical protein
MHKLVGYSEKSKLGFGVMENNEKSRSIISVLF